MIQKIERGLVDDDFLKDRITIKAYYSADEYYPVKLYNNGSMATFDGSGDDYQERPLVYGTLYNEIKAKLS